MIAVDTLPPKWMQGLSVGTCLTSKGMMVLVFVTVWSLVHVFIRWQLRNRRWAAVFCAAIERTLKRWSTTASPPTDFDPYAQARPTRSSTLITFLDTYILPCESAILHSDVDKKDWPHQLVVEWIDQEERRGTGAIRAEWLLWLASVVALAIGLLRILV